MLTLFTYVLEPQKAISNKTKHYQVKETLHFKACSLSFNLKMKSIFLKMDLKPIKSQVLVPLK